ncbi:MAG: hypothetical protein OXB94_05250 [Nitrospira sp.]|nr:hypothetical protein [Nitrospira sp.]
MTTSMVSLQDPYLDDMYVSEEARQLGQPIWDLLIIGCDFTSITEAEVIARSDALSEQFRHLAEIVREECAHLSSIREIVMHPAYQQIVGMGPQVLPLLLRELEVRPGHWFWALRAIVKEDPVHSDHQGVVAEMTQDWLNWARRKGLRW